MWITFHLTGILKILFQGMSNQLSQLCLFLFKTLSSSLWMPQCYNYSQTNLCAHFWTLHGTLLWLIICDDGHFDLFCSGSGTRCVRRKHIQVWTHYWTLSTPCMTLTAWCWEMWSCESLLGRLKTHSSRE